MITYFTILFINFILYIYIYFIFSNNEIGVFYFWHQNFNANSKPNVCIKTKVINSNFDNNNGIIRSVESQMDFENCNNEIFIYIYILKINL